MAEVRPENVRPEAGSPKRRKSNFENMIKKSQSKIFTDVVCGCVEKDNPVRAMMIWICERPEFDTFILTMIGLNCLFLCLGDPVCSKYLVSVIESGKIAGASNFNPFPVTLANLQHFNLTREAQYWEQYKCDGWMPTIHLVASIAEQVFTWTFFVEMVIKIIAKGFIWENYSYLRDPWNWLDFIVVVASLLAYIPGIPNTSALRTIRVLRPLRALTTIPGMRIIIGAMLNSINGLSYVVVLAMFFFFVWGIVGVQLWSGLFDSRCYIEGYQNAAGIWVPTTDPANFTMDENDESLCGLAYANPQVVPFCDAPLGNTTCVDNTNGRVCDPVQFWNGGSGASGAVVTLQRSCRRGPADGGPGFGSTDFDNIGAAMMTIFTAITLEGWVDSMYNVNDAYGNWWFGAIYWVSLVLFGAFFVMNLALAVMYEEYEKSQNELLLEEEDNATEMGRLVGEAMKLEAKKKKDAAKEAARIKAWGETTDNALIATMYGVANAEWFDTFITIVILFNTVVMAVEYDDLTGGMSPTLVLVLSILNFIFTVIFTIELVIKNIGLGPYYYISQMQNQFDGIIVIFSVVEILLACGAGDCLGDGGGIPGIAALRAFRLFRVFRLAKSWKDLREVLDKIQKSIVNVRDATVLLLVIMFIFALVGMEFFAGNFNAEKFGEGDTPRAHFDNLWWSFVTVFQVLTGENWNEVVYNGIFATDWIMATIYFVLLNIVGNYMILNLFLAILLDEFENGDDDEEEEEEEAKQNEGEDNEQTDEVKLTDPPGVAFFCIGADNGLRRACFDLQQHWLFDNFILLLILISTFLLAFNEPVYHKCMCIAKDFEKVGISAEQYTTEDIWTGNCAKYGSDGAFFYNFNSILNSIGIVIAVFFILEMVVKLIALGIGPESEHAYLNSWWNILDGTLVVLSIVDMASSGSDPCAGGSGALAALRALRTLRALRPLRAVRRFPGLRLVVNSLFRTLPAVINVSLIVSLFFVIFGIVGVQMFKGKLRGCNDASTIGPQNCTGFYAISGSDCGLLPTPVETQACLNSPNGTWFPRKWEQFPVNFDNIFEAIVAIFEISSGEMWPDIMYTVVDARGFDANGIWQEPVQDSYPLVALYFIMVQIVCAFLILNVFVGVVIDKYNEMKEEGDDMFETKEQRETARRFITAFELADNMDAVKVIAPPDNEIRKAFHWLSVNKNFDMVIMALIVMNTLLMAARHSNQGPTWDMVLDTGNTVFAIIFTIEMVIKMIGLGPTLDGYFYYSWNCFDCFLVVCSYLKFVPVFSSFGGLLTLFRILRVARIVRLVRSSDELKKIFRTLIIALPALGNVSMLLMLFLVIFAVLFMNIYSNVKHGENLGFYPNYENFGNSLMTMFRMSTGESFNGLMHDTMIKPPYCSPTEWFEEITINNTTARIRHDPNCGGPIIFTEILHCVMFTLTNFMLLNLIIAIILEKFMEDGELSEDDFDSFRDAWADQFPTVVDGVQYIYLQDLDKVLMRTNYPLGAKNTPFTEDRAACKRIKKDLNVKTIYLPNNLAPFIEYNATKLGLTRVAMKQKVIDNVAGGEFNEGELKQDDNHAEDTPKKVKTEDLFKQSEETLHKLEQKFVRRSQTKMNLNTVAPEAIATLQSAPKEGNTVRAHYNAVLIQMKWKSHIARRLVEAKRMAKKAMSPRPEDEQAS